MKKEIIPTGTRVYSSEKLGWNDNEVGYATVLGCESDGFYALETDTANIFGHDCDGRASKKGHGLFLFDTAFTVVADAKRPARSKVKKRVFKTGSQCAALLAHLLEGLTITRIQADHLYRIASLTRRIKDLREAGHKVAAKVKTDPTGRAYTEYSLRSAGRV